MADSTPPPPPFTPGKILAIVALPIDVGVAAAIMEALAKLSASRGCQCFCKTEGKQFVFREVEQ